MGNGSTNGINGHSTGSSSSNNISVWSPPLRRDGAGAGVGLWTNGRQPLNAGSSSTPPQLSPSAVAPEMTSSQSPPNFSSSGRGAVQQQQFSIPQFQQQLHPPSFSVVMPQMGVESQQQYSMQPPPQSIPMIPATMNLDGEIVISHPPSTFTTASNIPSNLNVNGYSNAHAAGGVENPNSVSNGVGNAFSIPPSALITTTTVAQQQNNVSSNGPSSISLSSRGGLSKSAGPGSVSSSSTAAAAGVGLDSYHQQHQQPSVITSSRQKSIASVVSQRNEIEESVRVFFQLYCFPT